MGIIETIKLVRFGLVGIYSNLAGYLIYILITHAGLDPQKAMTLLYIISAGTGYIGYKKWTFRCSDQSHIKTGLRYTVAHITGYSINLLILNMMISLGYAHQLAQACAILLLIIFFYVSYRFFVFPQPRVE